MRKPVLGEAVVWHEPQGDAYDALITAVWSDKCINLIFVSGDENKRDEYGRQIERRTSCSHKLVSPVHGFYWRFKDEEPNPYVPPQQV